MIDETNAGFVLHCQEFGLTTKEGRVLIQLLDGRSNSEIAYRTDLRLKEVERHLKSLMRKHALSTRVELMIEVRAILELK